MDISIDLREGTVRLFPLTKSLYDREEIARFLEKAEIKLIEIFGDWDGSTVTETSPSLLIIAEREF